MERPFPSARLFRQRAFFVSALSLSVRFHRGEHVIQFSSDQFFGQLGRRGDMKDDSSENVFQSILQEALASSSGMGRYVHYLRLSIQYFLCRLRRRPLSKVP